MEENYIIISLVLGKQQVASYCSRLLVMCSCALGDTTS